jgi:hypothetical protein
MRKPLQFRVHRIFRNQELVFQTKALTYNSLINPINSIMFRIKHQNEILSYLIVWAILARTNKKSQLLHDSAKAKCRQKTWV